MRSQWTEHGAGDLRTDEPPWGMKSLLVSVLMVVCVLTFYAIAALSDEQADEQLRALARQERGQMHFARSAPPAAREAYENETAIATACTARRASGLVACDRVDPR